MDKVTTLEILLRVYVLAMQADATYEKKMQRSPRKERKTMQHPRYVEALKKECDFSNRSLLGDVKNEVPNVKKIVESFCFFSTDSIERVREISLFLSTIYKKRPENAIRIIEWAYHKQL